MVDKITAIAGWYELGQGLLCWLFFIFSFYFVFFLHMEFNFKEIEQQRNFTRVSQSVIKKHLVRQQIFTLNTKNIWSIIPVIIQTFTIKFIYTFLQFHKIIWVWNFWHYFWFSASGRMITILHQSRFQCVWMFIIWISCNILSIHKNAKVHQEIYCKNFFSWKTN